MEEMSESYDQSEEPIAFKGAKIGPRVVCGAVDIFIVLSLAYFIPIVGVFMGVGYYLFKDALPLLNGQSFGKKIFQLRVQNQFDRSSTTSQFGDSFKRSLPIFIPVLNIVEFTLILLERTRIGDQWAGTLVAVDVNELKEAS